MIRRILRFRLPRKLGIGFVLVSFLAFFSVCLHYGQHFGFKRFVAPLQLESDKLSSILQGTYVRSSQQTCQQICQDIPEVSAADEKLLVQVGSIPIRPELEDDSGAIRAYQHIPTLPRGAWAFRRTETNSTGECQRAYGNGVAVIIPCRNRWKQVNVLLHYLIPLMQKQRLCFRIFVIEQREPEEVNRAMLFNVGFMEAIDRFRFDCVIFHDADLAPINDWNPYGCDSLTQTTVVHLGVALDNRNYKLRYPNLVGGVLKMTTRNFVRLNGHSNMYWGWGQEDDDLEHRMRSRGLNYVHVINEIARYHAIPHEPAPKKRIEAHRKLLKTARERIRYDGLSSLEYHLLEVREEPLYTYFLVDLFRKEENP